MIGLFAPRRRLGLGFGVGLALLSAGCQGSMAPPENLQVAIATGAGNDAVVRSSLRQLSGQMVQEFMRVHPGTNLHLRFLEEHELVESVRSRASLGAGPDLMITRTAPLARLEREGLLRQSSLGSNQLAPFQIQFLNNFRQANRYRALPFLLQPGLACFDRRRLPKPPANLDDLVARAAEGMRLGLPLQPDELLWTASGFNADRPLLQLFQDQVGTAQAKPSPAAAPTVERKALTAEQKANLLGWLNWLYQANIQPTLQFVDTSDELVQRLESRQFDWISCNATAIPRLKRALGANLGVSVLPAGNAGQPARPLARLLLIGFGRDSTPSQARLAESFALFVLNDFSQSNLIMKALGNMPVNQNVIVPVKDSPYLAAMETSLKSSTVPNFNLGVGLRQRTDPLRQLLKKNVYGEAKPQAVLAAMEALAGSSSSTPAQQR